MEDLSKLAGVRASVPLPTDGTRTYFEMYVKATGEVVSRGSFSSLYFTVRGKDRRKNLRSISAGRRVTDHGVQLPTSIFE